MKFDKSNKLVLIYSGVIYGIGALVFGILWATLGLMSLFLGWLVGAVIGLVGYILVVLQADLIIKTKSSTIVLALLAFAGRMLLYLAGLLLAALLTKYFEPEIFNIFTVFGAYLPPRIAIYITSLIERKGAKKGGEKLEEAEIDVNTTENELGVEKIDE
ncbi:MAG: hypothetical protein ACOX28_02755 [Bacilli bacterium]|jgi:hypothetical protein